MTGTVHAELGLAIASYLHASGAKLSGHQDQRGVDLVHIPQTPNLMPIDEAAAILLASIVAASLRQLEAASAPAPAPAEGGVGGHPAATIGSGLVVGG